MKCEFITTTQSCTVHLKVQANQKQKKLNKKKIKYNKTQHNPPFLKVECNYMNKGAVIISHCPLTIPHANKLDQDKFNLL